MCGREAMRITGSCVLPSPFQPRHRKHWHPLLGSCTYTWPEIQRNQMGIFSGRWRKMESVLSVRYHNRAATTQGSRSCALRQPSHPITYRTTPPTKPRNCQFYHQPHPKPQTKKAQAIHNKAFQSSLGEYTLLKYTCVTKKNSDQIILLLAMLNCCSNRHEVAPPLKHTKLLYLSRNDLIKLQSLFWYPIT